LLSTTQQGKGAEKANIPDRYQCCAECAPGVGRRVYHGRSQRLHRLRELDGRRVGSGEELPGDCRGLSDHVHRFERGWTQSVRED